MKILIVRVGRTGDMVMVTPAISALLNKYPDAEFIFLTSPDGKRTLSDFSPRIEIFWIYDRGKLLSSFSRRSIKNKIKEAHFDHIFCFEFKPSYGRLFIESDATIHNIKNVKKRSHYSKMLLDLVWDGENKEPEPYFVFLPVHDDAINQMEEYLSGFGISDTTFLIALHPTSSGAVKLLKSRKHVKDRLWPTELFAELAYRLKEYGKCYGRDLKIVMNLMPEECGIGNQIVQSSKESVIILTPPPNFQRYKAFLKRVDLLVTPNTGPMHIASAVGTSIIALFSGHNPEDSGPFVPSTQYKVLRSELTTTPERGIAAIPVDDVYNACIEIMG